MFVFWRSFLKREHKARERREKMIFKLATTTRPRRDDDATDENQRQRAQKNATHSFSSSLRVFVWSFVVSRVIRSDEEKRRHSYLCVWKYTFEFKSHAAHAKWFNLLRHCCAHRGRLQNSTKKKDVIKRTLVVGGRRCFFCMGHHRRVCFVWISDWSDWVIYFEERF